MSKTKFYLGIGFIYLSGFILINIFTKNLLFVFLGGGAFGTIFNILFGGFKYRKRK